jgi:hypothetical protein
MIELRCFIRKSGMPTCGPSCSAVRSVLEE